VATYVYNALDQRIGFDDSGGGQIWTVYNGTSADALPYADFNGSGTLLTRYVSGPGTVNGALVDELLARTSSGGTTAWYLTDKLDSVRDVVGSAGSVLDHVVYDSFGNILTETNASNGDRFKFAAMEYDRMTEQYYDRARQYDASIGRFSALDPLEFDAGDANLYGYTANDSLNAADPSGHDDVSEMAGALGTAMASGVQAGNPDGELIDLGFPGSTGVSLSLPGTFNPSRDMFPGLPMSINPSMLVPPNYPGTGIPKMSADPDPFSYVGLHHYERTHFGEMLAIQRLVALESERRFFRPNTGGASWWQQPSPPDQFSVSHPEMDSAWSEVVNHGLESIMDLISDAFSMPDPDQSSLAAASLQTGDLDISSVSVNFGMTFSPEHFRPNGGFVQLKFQPFPPGWWKK
jgi:RHS repeat-associated protein